MSAPKAPTSPLHQGGRLRAVFALLGFLVLTLPLMPVQAFFLRFRPDLARAFPHWYHRQVCRLLGIRIHILGAVATDRPVLLVANHTSWLDIPVLSAVAPVSFIAKREVASWPFVSWLAYLQRTVFVDRNRRASVSGTADEMVRRLESGDILVLFAEGTSSDGGRVLPFRSALFGAVMPQGAACGPGDAAAPSPCRRKAAVQTLSIAYTHLHGLPIGRAERPMVGWYGNMEMAGHAWALLRAGPLDVGIKIGPPLPLEAFQDRKALTRYTETEVRAGLLELLRGNNRHRPLRINGESAAGETGNAEDS
jgi:1-acyl-sn-glycerol-3-phosphate acyltransferase